MWKIKRIIYYIIINPIDSFFWEYHPCDIIGSDRDSSSRTFKSGNLGLLISILVAIGFILNIIFN